MCGIAGIFNFENQKVDKKILHRMDSVISHRGPDGHGELIYENIGLTNRRLAIIDPTPSGNQPMCSQDKRLWITFNGEIFNYKELMQDLKNKGYKFHSHTDTETILYGYKHYGEKFVEKLLGQFAFCIWDKKNKRFFLARDHLGVNPLYYAKVGKTFLFASEVKAILASGLIKKEISPESLHHYLSIFTIPAPLTIFKQIKSLLPGHSMTIDEKGIRIKRFWEIQVGLWEKKDVDFEILKEKLRDLLISAVTYAQVADVPVASFLSGGIDSSTVVALMAQKARQPIKTFSLWSEGGEAFDERKYAKLVAKRYRTDHNEITVTPNEIKKELPKIVYFFDQPTGGSLETYFISKFASSEVKVALSGLGGDELFGGYHELIFKTEILSSIYKKIPHILRHSFLNFLSLIIHSKDLMKTLTMADKFLTIPSTVKKRLFLYFAYQENEKKKLYDKKYFPYAAKYNSDIYINHLLEKVRNQAVLDKLSYLDLHTYTRDDLLLGMNLMSMANSLEARVPLLDPRLITFSAQIPPEFKIKRGVAKYIFKEIAKEWLPQEIINHKKTGFGLPRINYMKGSLKTMILSTLSEENIKRRGIFNYKYIREIVDQFYQQETSKMLWREHLRIWLLFIFEMWAQIYLDNTRS